MFGTRKAEPLSREHTQKIKPAHGHCRIHDASPMCEVWAHHVPTVHKVNSASQEPAHDSFPDDVHTFTGRVKGRGVACACSLVGRNKKATGVSLRWVDKKSHPFLWLVLVSNLHCICLPLLGRSERKLAATTGGWGARVRTCIAIPRLLLPCALSTSFFVLLGWGRASVASWFVLLNRLLLRARRLCVGREQRLTQRAAGARAVSMQAPPRPYPSIARVCHPDSYIVRVCVVRVHWLCSCACISASACTYPLRYSCA